MSNFYVYAYLRDDGSPYYIGKGSKRRINSSVRTIPMPVEPDRRIIVVDGLDEHTAFAIEEWLIVGLGRKDLNTGILRNRTNGGDGNSGKLVSNDTRKRMTAARTGKKHSEETKRKISQSSTGKIMTVEARVKIGAASAGRPKSKEFMAQMEKRRNAKTHAFAK